jgi:hypothetical protein
MKRMLLISGLLAILSSPLTAQSSSASSQSTSGYSQSTSGSSQSPSTDRAPAQADNTQMSSTTALQQKQAELNLLERQLEQLRKQIDKQKTKGDFQAVGGFGAAATSGAARVVTTRRVVVPGTASSAANLLVVPGESVDSERVAATLEDMRVMARILEKELKDFNLTKRQGIFNRWGPVEHSIEGLYLDGYGLVFQLEVGFALFAQETEDTEENQEAGVDKVWSETRQELFEPNRKRYPEEEAQRPYDAKKVESLKDSVARTLRHASNIRTLKSNECVAIVVTSGREAHNNRMMPYGMDNLVYGDAMTSGYGIMGPNASAPQGRSVLTIKAGKAHIDAFAQGEMDVDQFRSELQITLY